MNHTDQDLDPRAAAIAVDAASLLAEREGLGLTQSALAAKLGVSPVTISRWETGAKIIGQPVVLALALRALRDLAAGKK